MYLNKKLKIKKKKHRYEFYKNEEEKNWNLLVGFRSGSADPDLHQNEVDLKLCWNIQDGHPFSLAMAID